MTESYYGNTIGQWLTAAALILITIVLGRILYWVFKTVFKRFASKTSTILDDILLDAWEAPFVLLLLIAGIRYAVETLTLPEEIFHVVEHAYAFMITIGITWVLVRSYNAIHDKYLMPLALKTATDLDDHLLPYVRRALNVLLWSVGMIIGLNNAGYDVTAVVAGLGIGGLAFALAMQHTFGNLVSGFLIYTDAHLKLGDRVQVKGHNGLIDGVVKEIGLRTTRIKTRYEGRIVNVPNSMITDQDVVNVETEDGRQLFQVFKLAVGTPPEKVEEMIAILEEAVKSTEGTKELVVTGLVRVGEISSDVMLLYWVENDSSKVKTRTKVNMKILANMTAAGIEFTDRTYQHYNKDVEY